MKQQWRNFLVFWGSQSLSILGTSMTQFALLIWIFNRGGSVTAVTLLGFVSCLTYVLASPVAGVMVDRWDRRRVMLLADLGAGVTTAVLLGLNLGGRLEIWHLYLARGISGVFEAFQEPAFSASISLMVDRSQYTRANGLMGLGRSAARMFAPAAAGLLIGLPQGLSLVMIMDLITLSLSVITLLRVRVPRPAGGPAGALAPASFAAELRFGARYIWQRPGLRGLLATFFLVNLFGTITYLSILSPMILARSGGDEAGLGVVRMVMGLGGIAGGVVISSVWRGTRRKTRLYLLSTAVSFAVCDLLTAVSRGVPGWAAAGFLSELAIPWIVSPYLALWQEHVPPEVQGRVFSAREMIQVTSQPVGYLFGGLLADHLFEPMLQSGQGLGAGLSLLVGSGAGAGMAAMFVFTSVLGGLTGVWGLLNPAIRRLDETA